MRFEKLPWFSRVQVQKEGLTHTHCTHTHTHTHTHTYIHTHLHTHTAGAKRRSTTSRERHSGETAVSDSTSGRVARMQM